MGTTGPCGSPKQTWNEGEVGEAPRVQNAEALTHLQFRAADSECLLTACTLGASPSSTCPGPGTALKTETLFYLPQLVGQPKPEWATRRSQGGRPSGAL